jgi:hypothetical protein
MPGTRYKRGILDGVATVEAGSATLVAGVTSVTLGLDSINASIAGFANTVHNDQGIATSHSGQVLTITTDAALAIKVWYIAVGPRTTLYSRTESPA